MSGSTPDTPDYDLNPDLTAPRLTMDEWLDSIKAGNRPPLTRTEDNLAILNELRDENG